MVDKCKFIEKDLPSSGSMIVEINGMDVWMNTRRVREQLVLYRIQNGALITRHDTEKRRESFLIWPIVDRNFSLRMGKVSAFFNFMFFFIFRDDPRRSESIRVDPTRTGGPS